MNILLLWQSTLKARVKFPKQSYRSFSRLRLVANAAAHLWALFLLAEWAQDEKISFNFTNGCLLSLESESDCLWRIGAFLEMEMEIKANLSDVKAVWWFSSLMENRISRDNNHRLILFHLMLQHEIRAFVIIYSCSRNGFVRIRFIISNVIVGSRGFESLNPIRAIAASKHFTRLMKLKIYNRITFIICGTRKKLSKLKFKLLFILTNIQGF